MSDQTSPAQPDRLPPIYVPHPSPLVAHAATQATAPLTPTPPSFSGTHVFSQMDIKDEAVQTPSTSTATTATSTIELGGPTVLLSDQSASEVTPPPPSSSKGKNGATGPAEGKAKPHLCHVCGRGFTTGGHLQRHQRIHTGVKAFRCPFPGCDTKTSRQDNLQQHYRTHLSPSLRRGDGSQARAAVNAAMEAAGMKSVSNRVPRKSKGSNTATTPSSASATGSNSQLPSPYQTPTSQGPSPFVPYMYDPNGYAGYPLPPPPLPLMQNQPQASASSSRVPSPANGHHAPPGPNQGPATFMPTPPHHQYQFHPPPFPPYGYPTAIPHQAYRHFQGIPNPYGPPHPHHPLYSPGGMPMDHGHHLYSPLPVAFAVHSRDGAYNGLMTPGYAGPMANGSGYPSRTQTSTPLSQGHEDVKGVGELSLSAYGRTNRPVTPGRDDLGGDDGGDHGRSGPGMGVHRSGGPRRTPPHDMIAQGVVDPSAISRSVHPGSIHPSYGYPQPQPHHLSSYSYSTPQALHTMPGRQHTSALSQRASISSLSDGSGGGEGSQKASNSA